MGIHPEDKNINTLRLKHFLKNKEIHLLQGKDFNMANSIAECFENVFWLIYLDIYVTSSRCYNIVIMDQVQVIRKTVWPN